MSDVIVRGARSLGVLCLLAASSCGQLDVAIDLPDASLDARADSQSTPDSDSSTDSTSNSDSGSDVGLDADGAQACLPAPDHGWTGCGATPCSVCFERVAAFPFYYANHQRCARADDCAGHYWMCSSDCPEPATADECNGTSGEWDGCRGTGCSVCIELVSAYPKYFDRHPMCIRNPGCGGQHYTCNAACPAPSNADL